MRQEVQSLNSGRPDRRLLWPMPRITVATWALGRRIHHGDRLPGNTGPHQRRGCLLPLIHLYARVRCYQNQDVPAAFLSVPKPSGDIGRGHNRLAQSQLAVLAEMEFCRLIEGGYHEAARRPHWGNGVAVRLQPK